MYFPSAPFEFEKMEIVPLHNHQPELGLKRKTPNLSRVDRTVQIPGVNGETNDFSI